MHELSPCTFISPATLSSICYLTSAISPCKHHGLTTRKCQPSSLCCSPSAPRSCGPTPCALSLSRPYRRWLQQGRKAANLGNVAPARKAHARNRALLPQKHGDQQELAVLWLDLCRAASIRIPRKRFLPVLLQALPKPVVGKVVCGVEQEATSYSCDAMSPPRCIDSTPAR